MFQFEGLDENLNNQWPKWVLLTYKSDLAPLRVIMTMTRLPKGVIKGQPPNIVMFGIKLKVLMSTF